MLKKYSQVRVARGARLFFFIQPVILLSCDWLSGVGVAQLVSARLLKQEVPDSILCYFNVCFDFPLIRVVIALNTRKKEN